MKKLLIFLSVIGCSSPTVNPIVAPSQLVPIYVNYNPNYCCHYHGTDCVIYANDVQIATLFPKSVDTLHVINGTKLTAKWQVLDENNKRVNSTDQKDTVACIGLIFSIP